MESKPSFDKSILRKFVRNQGPIVIEIGAHHGEDSEHFLNMFKNCHLYLFEPDPRCIKKIKEKNLNCELFEGVVSDSTEDVLFFQSSGIFDWDGSGSIATPKKHKEIFPDILFKNEILVKSTTLDEYFKGVPFIDLIWMDVQGAERKVFDGGEETLKKTKCIYTEFCEEELYEQSPKMEEILNMLSNFELYGIYEASNVCGNLFLINKNL